MKRKRKVMTLEEFIAEANKIALEQTGLTKKQQVEKRYARSLEDARAKSDAFEESTKIRTGNYSLRTRILKNPWINKSPYNKALRWLHQEVFKNPKEYQYKKTLLQQGQLFIFEYKNPKFRNTSVLPWFDKHPLVLSLGPIVTNLGIRNIGFNLHLLPPKIRVIVLCGVFEIYKRIYRYQIFMKQQKPVEVKYQMIVKELERFGVKFAIRMYIPRRMRQIAMFPYKEWHKAIFIPSKGYEGILASKLIKEWQLYTRANGISVSPNLDWKKMI